MLPTLALRLPAAELLESATHTQEIALDDRLQLVPGDSLDRTEKHVIILR